jgi:dTDP-4-dehydrorhamnose reductase
LKKKILIIGAASVLATYLTKELKKYYEVYGLLNKRKIKLSGVKFLKNKLDKKTIDINYIYNKDFFFVINCAAITNVEFCENNKSKCHKINFGLVKKIINNINVQKTGLMQISTDQLFVSKKKLIIEKTKPKPLNEYSKSKFLAENLVKNKTKNFFIVRTNFFGWGTPYKNTFSDKIIFPLKRNKKVKVLNDVYFNPILLNDLAGLVVRLLKSKKFGVYNICSNEKLTKFDLAKKIAKRFNLPIHFLEPINRSISKIKRPQNMALSNNKLRKVLKIKPKSIDKQLDIMFKRRNFNSKININF